MQVLIGKVILNFLLDLPETNHWLRNKWKAEAAPLHSLRRVKRDIYTVVKMPRYIETQPNNNCCVILILHHFHCNWQNCKSKSPSWAWTHSCQCAEKDVKLRTNKKNQSLKMYIGRKMQHFSNGVMQSTLVDHAEPPKKPYFYQRHTFKQNMWCCLINGFLTGVKISSYRQPAAT